MTTNSEPRFSYLFIGLGLGLGAIAGLMFALLARKETRELLHGDLLDPSADQGDGLATKI